MEISNNNQNEQLNPNSSKKSYLKFVLGFFGIVAAVFIGTPLAINIYNNYKDKHRFDDYFQAEKEYLDALKNDTYGGKTPQETYEMFVKTIKTNNILEAAKFYYGDNTVSAYKRFKKMQDDGSLENWINELPKWGNMKEVEYWDSNGKEFEYEYVQKKEELIHDLSGLDIKIPVGQRIKSIIFQQSKSANIWKIYEL
ncbi:MAG: hypothetical protein QMD86_00290 [Patescibacteria group bacterium]|nr:hypothetical protein [Patescibacteria group bacterium]